MLRLQNGKELQRNDHTSCQIMVFCTQKVKTQQQQNKQNTNKKPFSEQEIQPGTSATAA